MLLANGCFSLPETQSKTCQVTVLPADQKPDRVAMSNESSLLKSKEYSSSTSKECSSLISKECSLSSSKESSLSTSHFSVGEKVRSSGVFLSLYVLKFVCLLNNLCLLCYELNLQLFVFDRLKDKTV